MGCSYVSPSFLCSGLEHVREVIAMILYSESSGGRDGDMVRLRAID